MLSSCSSLLRFFNNEDGAVTVDWVVLTAAIALIGVIATVGIRSALSDKTAEIVVAIGAST